MLSPCEWRLTVNGKHKEDSTDRQSSGFSGAYSTQIARPTPKLTYKRHILGYQLASKTIPIVQNCALRAILYLYYKRHHSKLTTFSCFEGLGPPLQCRNSKIFQRYLHAHTNLWLFIKKRWKLVHDKWNNWGKFLTIFCVRAHCDPSRIF